MSEQDTTQSLEPPRLRERLEWTVQPVCVAGRSVQAAPLRLLGAELTIGRSSQCTLPLPDDPRTSRRHATLRVVSDAVTITDSSANGTFVNGRRIDSGLVRDGDVIRVGDSFAVLRRRGPAHGGAAPTIPLLGVSPAMDELRRTIGLVGPTATSVLIVGETGTGKELVARALHACYRANAAFVPVNCSAIPASLAEAAFFGHLKGAFSGADSPQPGLFREADGGVLFLDEVGELPSALQPKLLRALEDKLVCPVGATRATACDVRVLAATNRDLRAAVHQGAFRADLYARLAELTIRTPTLRDRREDILPILTHELGPAAAPLAPDLVDALLRHDWPFNVRELVKLASELALRGGGSRVRLGLELVAHRLELVSAAGGGAPGAPGKTPPLPTRDELVALLRSHHGIVADVARATGRSRKQIYRWLDRHGLALDDFRAPEGSGR